MAFTTTSTLFSTLNKKPTVAFSYTKIKNFRSCPLRHFHYDVAKDIREPESDELRDGNELHECMHKRLRDGTPLPAPIAEYEKWAQQFLTHSGDLVPYFLVEQKYGLRRDFSPSPGTPRDPGGFFDRQVWYRSIADAVKIQGNVALNWDWKTGKVKEDPLQIVLAAAVLMAHHPQLQAVRSQYVWLAYDTLGTPYDVTREELPGLWASIMPEIEAIQHAHDIMTFPPKKNGLCRDWCAVETCQFHGT